MTDIPRSGRGAGRTDPPGDGRTSSTSDDRSIGQIIADITRDFRDLLRDEVALAKAEFNQALKKIITGVILLAVGGVLATTGLSALVASAILGLTAYWSPWVAALVVGVAIIVIGGILAMAGIRNFRAAEIMPDRTIRTLKDDAQAVKEGLQ